MIETVSAIFLERGRSKTAIKITSYVLLFVYISFGLSGYQPSLFGWHRLFIGSDGLAHTHNIQFIYLYCLWPRAGEAYFFLLHEHSLYELQPKKQIAKKSFFTVSLLLIICIALKQLSSATQFVDCRFRRDSVGIVFGMLIAYAGISGTVTLYCTTFLWMKIDCVRIFYASPQHSTTLSLRSLKLMVCYYCITIFFVISLPLSRSLSLNFAIFLFFPLLFVPLALPQFCSM